MGYEYGIWDIDEPVAYEAFGVDVCIWYKD